MMQEMVSRLLAVSLGFALVSCASTAPSTRTSGGSTTVENSPPRPNPVVHYFTIGRVASAPLSNAEADAILAGATRVLRNPDSSSDASANVILRRRGDVRIIPGPEVISSPEDYARLSRSGVQIAVVEAVNFCSRTKAGILGCSHIGNGFIAIVRQSANEDIAWAHEFGHNCGLGHRDASTAVMHTYSAANRRSLTKNEARNFETRGSGSGSSALLATTEEPAEADTAPPPVGEFLQRVYVHGIPYSHVAQFGPEDAPKFQAVLADSSRKAQWLNASVALGAIGTPEAVGKVRDFVRTGRGRLGHTAYQAKLAAVVGLGYGAARGTTGDAFAQLSKGCSVETWTQDLQWSAPGRAAGDETAKMMASASFSGLALSGKEAAGDALTDAASKAENDSPLRDRARSALKELRKVRAQGLRKYSESHGH